MVNLLSRAYKKKNTTHLYDQESEYMEVKHGPNNK